MMQNPAGCASEIKFRIAIRKATFKIFFFPHKEIGLKFKEETSKALHLEHSFVWY